MAEHQRYAYMHFAVCGCFDRGYISLLDGEASRRVTFEPEQVTFDCLDCGGTVGVFYREPEIERVAARVDKSIIGRLIRARRFVSWVGYAKNPRTVQISDKKLDELAKEKVIHGVMRATAMSVVLTDSQAKAFLDDCPWPVRAGFYRDARWEIRRNAFHTDPLSSRGFWFQDVPVDGAIIGVVLCVTGAHDPGGRSYDYDGYDDSPPCLCGEVHHSLYVIAANSLKRVGFGHSWTPGILVHPLDVEVVNETN